MPVIGVTVLFDLALPEDGIVVLVPTCEEAL